MFVDPETHEPLKGGENGCLHGSKIYYPLVENERIIDFVNERDAISSAVETDAIRAARVEYDRDDSIDRYENFLSWLFETLEINEKVFRKQLVDRLSLRPGDRLLITSCGLGEEVNCIQDGLLKDLDVHLQDISKSLVLEAFRRNRSDLENLTLSVSDAMRLPYPDCYFDKILHFGGINLFEDVGKAIEEMNRVCKVDGRIVFGDEGISPNLVGTDLYKALVFNNPLWSAKAPVDKLPLTANGIRVDYVLNNCFWIIEFTKSIDLPSINMSVEHKGYRGGSIESRYFGMIEGVSPELKDRLYSYAKLNNVSVNNITQDALTRYLEDATCKDMHLNELALRNENE